jgi:hypothetical protein
MLRKIFCSNPQHNASQKNNYKLKEKGVLLYLSSQSTIHLNSILFFSFYFFSIFFVILFFNIRFCFIELSHFHNTNRRFGSLIWFRCLTRLT